MPCSRLSQDLIKTFVNGLLNEVVLRFASCMLVHVVDSSHPVEIAWFEACK